jgi:ArsR family transcriptional regulator
MGKVHMKTKAIDDKLFVLHAEVCKSMANPTRLKILNALRHGEQSVEAMAKSLKLRKANLSQHLAVLRQRGIVATRREGLNIYYRCANPKMLKACEILREVLLEQLQEGGRLMEQATRRK